MLTLHQKVISTLEEPSMNVSEFQDLVFLLGRLWKLDLDEIRNHWTLALFARGLVHQSKNVSDWLVSNKCIDLCVYRCS